MKASKVYFAPVTENEALASIQAKVGELFDAADLEECIQDNDLVGIKTHFGEHGNDTHIAPEQVFPVVEKVKSCNAKPFLTDSNTLYAGHRGTSPDHVRQAMEHGFTLERAGAPVVIMGGLRGNEECMLPVDGVHYEEVPIVQDVLRTNTFIVLSHLTGHLVAGFGGAMKNVGMGLASRRGKLSQHSDVKPYVREQRCKACGLCIKWCPERTISMQEDKAVIDQSGCIGCAECLSVCRYKAIGFDWTSNSQSLQEKMVEHAAAVVTEKKGRIGFFNYLLKVTKDCDCLGIEGGIISPDIGILASKDMLALDVASLDLFKKTTGQSVTDLSFPHLSAKHQIDHAVKLGLGSKEYELITL